MLSATVRFLLLIVLALGFYPPHLHAETCAEVTRELNRELKPPIDEAELANILETLNATGNRSLPPQFVTKREARREGWQPGMDYKGGRRGPKRLMFSNDGLRLVTVDHYSTFREVPPCR